jgi:3-hydroxybutyryl-CoA dehydrogenase
MSEPSPVLRVGVIGAGVMGRGISQVCLQAGLGVRLFDVEPVQLVAAREEITARLDRLVAKEKLTSGERDRHLAGLQTVDAFDQLGTVDLVIETAPENLSIKSELFQRLDAAYPPEVILATNTSSLPISGIAAGVVYGARTVGLHFFNPAPVLQLVEVIPGPSTSPGTMDAAFAFARQLGKTPVLAVDRPGFIVSRVLDVMVNEAARCVMDGNTPENVDAAMRLGANHPIGPLALADLMGIDILVHVMESLEEGFGPAYAPAPILREMIDQGRLGRKVGHGFYDYPDGSAKPAR